MEKELDKIENVWHGFSRKMVKGGYQRKSAPNRKVHGNSQVDGEVDGEVDREMDWSFKISNQGLRDITNVLLSTTPSIHHTHLSTGK